jgi:manganese/zinc/iron transport system substrate-binding protein
MWHKNITLILTTLLVGLITLYIILIQITHSHASNKPIVVCTTTIIADAVKNIGADRIDLKILMTNGVDPHTYKPIEQDIIAIAQAQLIFYNGLHLEARMTNLFEKMKEQKITVAVTQTIPHHLLIFDQNFDEFADPHVWFDPHIWIFAVKNIAKHLCLLMPEHALEYQKNAQNYIENIELMYQETHAMLQTIPQAQRILITGHDAFSYFARAYKFQVLSLQGINTATQPGTADVQNLIQFIVHHKIPTIFAETCTPERNLYALIQGARAQGVDVKLGNHLFADSLGTGDASTYIGTIQANVANIAQGLKN